MNARIITFSNTELDTFGMPTTYKSYLVKAREARPGEANHGDGIARVYSMSSGAEALNPDHVVAAGGAEKALEEAFARLRLGKDGLNERIRQVDWV